MKRCSSLLIVPKLELEHLTHIQDPLFYGVLPSSSWRYSQRILKAKRHLVNNNNNNTEHEGDSNYNWNGLQKLNWDTRGD